MVWRCWPKRSTKLRSGSRRVAAGVSPAVEGGVSPPGKVRGRFGGRVVWPRAGGRDARLYVRQDA